MVYFSALYSHTSEIQQTFKKYDFLEYKVAWYNIYHLCEKEENIYIFVLIHINQHFSLGGNRI